MTETLAHQMAVSMEMSPGKIGNYNTTLSKIRKSEISP